ncbi:hypothetical protein FSP39_011510 [Pinctada imbricata]|uniref:Heat shock 70 kDa protein 12B n=1 Tax=Pinctada imbricata TaxID=66713 RepID=A0AA88YCT0_PINIB|nr:hypothetical protein FSP39_011510 [Pinctada imbricata]
MADMSRNFLLVAAIDFGTTYSGYAFSTRHQFATERERIFAFQWASSVGRLISPKTPTCALFKPDKSLDSCGFRAEERYAELASDNSHRNWYFFKRIKMKMYQKQHFERNFVLEDDTFHEDKDPMLAIDVFSAILKFFKDHLLGECWKQLPEMNIGETDIRWVLTVPAIWNDSAKQFMREAAEMAGLPKENLFLALEPEAASLFCKLIPTLTMVERKHIFKRGTKYIVFDAGGGTIDITVHKVLSSGNLEEVHKASGGDWGATRVDEQFVELLSDLFTHEVYRAFINNHKYDELDLMEDFEVKKRSLGLDVTSITIKMPNSLLQTYSDMHPDLELTNRILSIPKYSNKVKLVADKLKMDSDIVRELFSSSCNPIVQHLRSIMIKQSVKDAKTLLLVGGFSESAYLQDTILTHFPDLTIIIPSEPSLAVVKGAVLYGHDPLILESRICKLTYGVATNMPFEDGLDPEDCVVEDESGNRFCTNRFSVHVRIGQLLETNSYQTSHTYRTLKKEQNDLRFYIYTSRSDNPRYTTDSGCEYLGQLTLRMPKSKNSKDRSAHVKMKFGGTELVVSAKETVSRKKVEAKLKLLD